jgi:putative ABC transport system permease protein
VRQIDPQIAIGEPRTLEDIVGAAFAARRYQVQLFVVFGLVALFIASLGVYSVTAYGVSRRRREMNIRVALGAERQQVVAMAMRQGTVPVAAGLAAGLAGALAIGGVVASLLFDVRPRDPAVIGAVAAIVAGAGVLACFVAVRRGLVLDPAAALRDE